MAAEVSLKAAQANLAAVLAGPNAQDVLAAQAALDAAVENRTLAELNLQELLAGPDAADVANAEDARAAAQAVLDAAIASRDDLFAGPDAADLARADGAVLAAQATVDAAVASRTDLLDGPDALEIAGADGAVFAAAAVLNAAVANRDDLLDSPEPSDIARADDAVLTAEAVLDAARARQDDLLDMPDDSELASARDDERSAGASLDAARASQEETVRGPRATQIEQESQSVRAAALAVEAAQIRLRNTQIISPFDGTVAAVNLSPGEFMGTLPSAPAIVLLTPEAFVLKIQIGETDYPNVQLDQTGVVIFDALPGVPFPFSIMELGLSPTITQGVVTYEATAALIVPPEGARPAPGMNARGQIVTESRVDVLVIPPRAIRRKGSEEVVDVRRGGQIEEQVIVTGLSDTVNVEVVGGLEEGDILVVPVLVTGSSQADAQPTLPSGIR